MPLASALATLESSGLLRRAQMEPELEYLFRHALVQDAAYASLLRTDQRRLHQRVGEVLETLYPGELASRQVAPVLAHHFFQAGDVARAEHYYTLAGDAALHSYANAEAAHYYQQALALARQAAKPLTTQQPLYTRLGRALELSSAHQRAADLYAEWETVAHAADERASELAAMLLRATLYSTPTVLFNSDTGRVLATRALALARAVGDPAAEAKALWNLCLAHYSTSDFQQARTYGEQSLALARQHNLREQMAYTLNDLARCYSGARLYAMVEEACNLWRELNNLPMLVDSLQTVAYNGYVNAKLHQGLEAADEAYALSQHVGNVWGQAISRLMAGYALFEMGQFTQALAAQAESVRLGETAQLPYTRVRGRAHLCEMYLFLHAPTRALAEALTAESIAQAYLPNFQYEARLMKLRAALLLHDDALAQSTLANLRADASLSDATRSVYGEADIYSLFATQQWAATLQAIAAYQADWAGRLAQPNLADLEMLVLGVQVELGQWEAACATASALCTTILPLASPRSLWKALALLAQAEAHLDHAEAAQAATEQAHTHLINIVAGLVDEDLCQHFLSQPLALWVLQHSRPVMLTHA